MQKHKTTKAINAIVALIISMSGYSDDAEKTAKLIEIPCKQIRTSGVPGNFRLLNGPTVRRTYLFKGTEDVTYGKHNKRRNRVKYIQGKIDLHTDSMFRISFPDHYSVWTESDGNYTVELYYPKTSYPQGKPVARCVVKSR
jgi:hypothetical protein